MEVVEEDEVIVVVTVAAAAAVEAAEVVGVEEEVEELKFLIFWMMHSILIFRYMPTVRSAQRLVIILIDRNHFQLILKQHPTAVAEATLIKLQTQIPGRVLQIEDEVEVSVVGVEDTLRCILGIDIMNMELELLRRMVIVAVEDPENWERMRL